MIDPGAHGARGLAPTSALPLAYFATAHAALALALLVLVVRPGLPDTMFYQPKVIALVHLLTIGWLSGSILGALYIVGPLALRVPMRVSLADWAAMAAFAIGAAGMVAHFWILTYDGMVWSAAMVVAAVAWVGTRVMRGMPRASAPWGIRLHVGLAFFNFLAAATFGMLIGLDRSRGFLGLPAMGATWAHAHLAAIGWVMMLVLGLGYRLIPMMLPAAMPVRRLWVSALLIQAGLAMLFVSLLRGSPWTLAGSLVIAAGIGSFAVNIRGILRTRKPRPPALPRRDWSMWQVYAAMIWLIVAVACGVTLAATDGAGWRHTTAWVYGVAGLIGFLAQMVTAVQGRIVPWYVWYRAQAARGGVSPPVGANELPSAAFARVIFLSWTAGVPLLAAGLATGLDVAIRAGAISLLTGVVTGAAHITAMIRTSRPA